MSKKIPYQYDRTNPKDQEKSEPKNQISESQESSHKSASEPDQIAETLKNTEERIKRLSRQTLEVLEADRQTISKELHDSICASLAAIKFSLEEKEMTRLQNSGRLDESLDQEIAYLMETIKETKRISANLRPTTLDDLGLLATIEWYVRQFKHLYGDIQIDYTNKISEHDIPEDMKIIIYRIIQEGLTNAEKHSEADTIRLSLEKTDNNRAISLSIVDNGRGFEVDEILSNKDPLSGYGLTAMLERCEIIGGSFHVSSSLDQGTTITAILPIAIKPK